jgi:transcriptional regulator with XRE-family HTH domain
MAKPKTKVLNLIDAHVGSWLRMRRMMLGMSQEKLGEAFGLTFQQVQKYEKGVNRMGSSRLQHAAHILQVSVPFFFEGAPGGHELRKTAHRRLMSMSSSPAKMG